MKKSKILFFLFFIMSPQADIFAQFVNEVPLSEIKSKTLIISEFPKLLSTKITVCVDYGQPKESILFPSNVNILCDEKKEPIKFNSSVDFLNYFENIGYELKHVYVTVGGNPAISSTPYWILRKSEKLPN